jgi:pyruvate dehydrogenase (quinone)
MADTVSDFLVRRLADWGIKRVFGYPGDGINGVMGALQRRQDRIEFVQVRHEEMAAFMACGHAKFTDEVGVCVATSGPGAIHLLNGLYDAKLDHQPVVAIVGQQRRAALGGHYQQEVDLVSLFKDVAGDFLQMVTTPEQVRHVVDRALRIAQSRRTVTCVVLPNDVQDLEARDPPHEHGTVHSGLGYKQPRIVPALEDLQEAAEILNDGKRVAILVGAGALHAGAEVVETAELLGAGIAKALLGKAVVRDDLPFVTGAIGLLGTKPSYELMRECDTLLMVGSSFPYSEFLPQEGQARAVQIDIDPRMLSIRYPMAVNLVGDSVRTLRLLIPMLYRKSERSWRQRIERNVAQWWQTLEKRAMIDADPVNPQRVFWELSPRLPERCILCGDSGSTVHWFARDLKVRPGMKASLSGGLASMGSAVPYAIAAKFAYPDRMAFAILGDGAMQMNGMNELVTIGKYWERWADPRLVVLVLNNRDLNMVTWEQRAMAGDPKFEASQDVPDFPYADYARLAGLEGIAVDRPEQLAPAWERALVADRPVVVEVRTDPNVPPLPPHVTWKQAKAYASAILKGDPDSWDIIRQVAMQVTA